MVALPTVILDTTVVDLLRRASPQNADCTLGMVAGLASSCTALTEDYPRNVKYLYQDSPFTTIRKSELDKNQNLQRLTAVKYLSIVPQRDAFISGNTPVVLFEVAGSDEQKQHARMEAERTIDVLHPTQRPNLIFCPGPTKIPMKENGINVLASKMVIDGLEGQPVVFDLDKQWYLNSKAALATSGLPTPKCDIIEMTGYAPEAKACCQGCRNGDAYYISPECTGSRSKWLDQQLHYLLDRVAKRSIPFVLKLQQSFGGFGTFLVTNEQERSKLIENLSDDILRKLFSAVTPTNHHLQPATILLSDLVEKIVGNCGLTFLVTASGDGIFLAVADQMIDSKSHGWIGSIINYPLQTQLEQKFSLIMGNIVTWLHSHGYCGLATADILETERDSMSGASRQKDFHIVDLNVRTSGSLSLPLLRSHFTDRGLQFASSFLITVRMTRDEFIRQWPQAFESGTMCIMSWYTESVSRISTGSIAIGADTLEALQHTMTRLGEMTEKFIL